MKERNVSFSQEFTIPFQAWYTLKQACELKNLNLKTAYNRKYLQPNRGISGRKIGGRKSWRRDTILEWIWQTDEDIEGTD